MVNELNAICERLWGSLYTEPDVRFAVTNAKRNEDGTWDLKLKVIEPTKEAPEQAGEEVAKDADN